jgi:hypothetical protein
MRIETMTTKLAAMALFAAVVCSGCAEDAKDEEPTTGTAMSTPTTASPAMKTSTPAPAVAAVAVPEKDMTHVVTKDEPYFAATPAQAKKADGTLKAGTKVVLMMPRGPYAQVMTADGKRVYTSTAGLSPVGK